MKAAASVGPAADRAGGADTKPNPLVLIDGRPSGAVWVASLTMEGPIDTRRAVLVPHRSAAGYEAVERARLQSAEGKRGRAVSLLQPAALIGGEHRLMPLMQGRIVEVRQRLGERTDRLELEAVDGWSAALDLDAPSVAELRDPEDGSATVAGVIERLNASGDLGLRSKGLPVELRRRKVSPGALRGRTLGSVLGSVLEEQGLVVRRSMRWDGHRILEPGRELCPVSGGRPIRLGPTAVTEAAGMVETIRAAWPARRPVKLVAEGEGQLVESTFGLVGGWDPADESLADDEYGKSSSSDFDAVATVFRLWVLNEDGAYSGAPFNRGEPFDLTGFFEEGEAIEAQRLRFENPLTQDTAKRRLSVAVEMSTDGGSSWSRYPGDARVLSDRAGVYLADDALPGGFLSAAKVGAARVRVTASLRSPLPLRMLRWRGNPFAGSFERRRLAVGDAFRRWRLAPGSKHSDAVASGERPAAEIDDRAALTAWLARVAERRTAAADAGQARIDVAGPMLGLRIGDRLDRIAGRRIGAALTDPAAGGATATLERIEHRWETARTELRWRVR